MTRRCRAFVLTLALGAAALPAVVAAAAVYTWVDKNGVRHYSDRPANPRAQPVNLAMAVGTAPITAVRAVSPATSERAPVPRTAGAAQPRMSPTGRAARCTKLRDEVKSLQSARRVQVTKNGKSRYLSGENLVAFKQKLKSKMRVACAASVKP